MGKKAGAYDTIIIGGGVAGLSAAVYCGRFKMKTLVIGDTPGGTIALAGPVENYPGYEKINGYELAQNIRNHALKQEGITIIDGKATKVESHGTGCFKVSAENQEYLSKTIIYATGTEWRKLNVPGEAKYASKGVHYCAMCDGPLYRNKVVGVVGGSDGAAKEALLLSEHAKKVIIIMRGKKLMAEPINTQRVLAHKKISLIKENEVTEIKGNEFASSVQLKKMHMLRKELKLDALFVEIGHVPLTSLAKEAGVNLNEHGEIVIDQDGNTNIPGFFAAGDCCSRRFKQAITSVGEGVTAAYTAYHFINETETICLIDDKEVEKHGKSNKSTGRKA